ncbi:MAG: hypothetical protein J0I09_07485 [Sphingobacteriia bacterium]|nr:hypothetical protein [Sphingobacteriia bacterium]
MCGIIKPPESTTDFMILLDIAFKSATILIAAFNAIFAVKIFYLKDEKDATEKEKDRKIQLLKTLVLDNNVKNYYSIFEEIENSLTRLKQISISQSDKKTIDENLSDLFIKLRYRFYDTLLAVDDQLYESIKLKADDLQTYLTDTIFDQGVNLSHLPKYDMLITQKLVEAKTSMIKILFEYRPN